MFIELYVRQSRSSSSSAVHRIICLPMDIIFRAHRLSNLTFLNTHRLLSFGLSQATPSIEIDVHHLHHIRTPSAIELTLQQKTAPPLHTTKTHNNSAQDEKRREDRRKEIWYRQARSVYLCENYRFAPDQSISKIIQNPDKSAGNRIFTKSGNAENF